MRTFPYIILITLIILTFTFVNAIENIPTHLNVFYTDSLGIERVHSTSLKDVDEITFGRSDTADVYNKIIIDDKELDLDSVRRYDFGTNVPVIHIFTDTIVDDVFSKQEYLSGYAVLEGFGAYDDLDSVSVGVRGRGNTSWLEEKKPYRLKFAKKQPLCGLAPSKSFVLIANYIDATHIRNAAALKLSQLLEMSFANHSIPVNVEFNGIKKGAYMLSEKIGIGKGSVNIDELTGILWELDKAYDEEYKFISPGYNLPVMLSDPDPADILDELNRLSQLPEEGTENPEEPGEEITEPGEENPEEPGEEITEPGEVNPEEPGEEITEPGEENPEEPGEEVTEPEEPEPNQITAEEWFEGWKKDFIKMEESVKNGTPEETIDMNSLVDYILVFLVTGNNEIDWPKSVKLYKPAIDSLYVFGPVWDFDWGFGYALPETRKLFVTSDAFLKGSKFFYDIVKTPQFKELFEKRWKYFKTELLPIWFEYLDEYAELIRVSALQDGEIWQAPERCSADFDNQVKKLREWINSRIDLIESDKNYMLY